MSGGSGGELAFRIARSPAAGALVRAGFAGASALLPLRTVARHPRVGVWAHPRPVFGTWHHIVVPRVGVPDVFALTHPRHARLRAELAALLTDRATSALVNAGPRQDVGQVHWHLTDDPWPTAPRRDERTWPDWPTALLALPTLPDVDDLFTRGFSLLRPAGQHEVLIT